MIENAAESVDIYASIPEIASTFPEIASFSAVLKKSPFTRRDIGKQ
jgi:hypothetical protein